ncbi:MAG: IclR family transcriptional regulator [Jatrophihabitans sp.]|nr:MAG: IclR family transcriptional regulator [Jatrophihabitans sp.]
MARTSERAGAAAVATTREDGSSSQSIAAVERAIDVLLLFSRSTAQSLGVTEISSELDMPKAAVHRILTSLRTRDLIAFEPSSRRYMLGAAALALGRAYLGKIDIRALASEELQALSRETGETATLSVRHGDMRVYVDQVVPKREVRMEVAIGGSYPLHAGASSKAFLAFMGGAERKAYLDRNPLQALTDKTLTSRTKLERDLAAARRSGYTSSYGERQTGAASVAAPVYDHDGQVVAVVSVSGPAERLRQEADACAVELLAATGRLSARLGYLPSAAGGDDD